MNVWRAIPSGPIRIAVAGISISATGLFVAFLHTLGFRINQIIGFTGFTVCLVALIAAAIAIQLHDRSLEHDDHKPRRPASPRYASSSAAGSASVSRRK